MADNFNARLYARGYSKSVTTRTTPVKATPAPTTSNMCAPPCANCGLLECLCRPRFFAGQLLTEHDLNRLDSYIRAKNRMHNIQLHGSGVVNGLQVRCDTCATGVVVGTGYAIDPCGEDIVVCGDTSVDICALIKQCQTVDVTCSPSSRVAGKSVCDEVDEDWVLAIRYNETQTRAITAVRSTPSCACGAKGGACSCGCGTTGKSSSSTAATNAMSSSSTAKPRATSPECEATAICEGYAFDVFRAPIEIADLKAFKATDTLTGGLIDSFRCCFEPLLALLPEAFKPGGTAESLTLWLCNAKQALIGFLSNGPQANCQLVTRLEHLTIPKAGTKVELAHIAAELELVMLDALLACLCNALLPPAPCGTSDDRVPLAVVTVRKKDCKILRVCNWTPLRKMVITMPTLEYWLGWLPFWNTIRELLAKMCCQDLRLPTYKAGETGVLDPAYEVSLSKLNPAVDKEYTAENQTMTKLLMNAFARGNSVLEPAAVMSGVFGLNNDAEVRLPMTATEQANVGPFMMLHQLARPFVASFVPTEVATDPPMQVAEHVSNGGDDTASLYTRVAALEKALAAMTSTTLPVNQTVNQTVNQVDTTTTGKKP